MTEQFVLEISLDKFMSLSYIFNTFVFVVVVFFLGKYLYPNKSSQLFTVLGCKVLSLFSFSNSAMVIDGVLVSACLCDSRVGRHVSTK